MQRELTTFVASVLLASGLAVAAALALPEQPPYLRSLPLIFLAPLPLILVYVLHRRTGEPGSPFRGLTWGPTPWFFLVWLGGIALATLALVITVGLNIGQFDPGMQDYIALNRAAAEEQTGESMGSAADGTFRVVGMVTAIAAPTIGAWISAVIMCLSTFPWLGWYYRRIMPAGRMSAIGMLMLLWLAFGAASGMAENPYLSAAPIWVRVLLTAVGSAAAVPALVWLFLRTRSAVIPALALASYQAALAGGSVFLSGADPTLAPPTGIIGAVLMLLAGIGLWVWREPGGADLAVRPASTVAETVAEMSSAEA